MQLQQQIEHVIAGVSPVAVGLAVELAFQGRAALEQNLTKRRHWKALASALGRARRVVERKGGAQ